MKVPAGLGSGWPLAPGAIVDRRWPTCARSTSWRISPRPNSIHGQFMDQAIYLLLYPLSRKISEGFHTLPALGCNVSLLIVDGRPYGTMKRAL